MCASLSTNSLTTEDPSPLGVHRGREHIRAQLIYGLDTYLTGKSFNIVNRLTQESVLFIVYTATGVFN